MKEHESLNVSQNNAKTPETDLVVHIQDVKRIIEEEAPSLATFAGDASLKYTPSLTAETFGFDHRENRVVVPIDWFLDKGHSQNNLRWAFYHELSHFVDMRENPETYLDKFEYIENSPANRKIVSFLEEKLKADGVSSEDIDRLQTKTEKGSSLEQIASRYLHTLYNTFDDLTVNKLVEQKAPVYSDDESKVELAELYTKLGFQPENLKNTPKHIQFISSFLMKEMIPNASTEELNPRVLELLNKKIYGNDLTQIINRLKPQSGELPNPTERFDIVRKLIEPIYIELIKEDLQDVDLKEEIEKQKIKGKQESENGQKDQGEQEEFIPFEKWHETKNREIPKEVLEQLAEEKKYRKATPEERAKLNTDKQKQKFDERHEIKPETRNLFETRAKQVEKARHKMREFWKSLIGMSIEMRRQKVTAQQRGNVNVDDYIEQYPSVVEATQVGNWDKLKIYERMDSILENVNKPERIEVSLVCDISGSMDMDPSKLLALQKSVALMLLSLKDFNYYLSTTREVTHTKLVAQSEVYVFNNTFEKPKAFSDDISINLDKGVEDAQIIKTFEYLANPGGSTDDAQVLQEIIQSVDPQTITSIQKDKVRKIVFEITDGRPDDPDKTREHIDQLLEMGVIPLGFQIGNVSEEERNTFEQIWNYGRTTPLGFYIGPDIDLLPGELMKTLRKRFGDIKL